MRLDIVIMAAGVEPEDRAGMVLASFEVRKRKNSQYWCFLLKIDKGDTPYP